MGTPDFAVPSLEALINKNYEIVKVVTQPDRPRGRGKKLTPSPVKEIAQIANLEVFQPENLKTNKEELDELLKTECDFLVVVAFGQILPNELLEHPKIAPLNVHASLLPSYRGAAPIARSVMEGEEESGVTIQWIVEELDMGDILYQIPCKISSSDTSADLHDRLRTIGAQALVHCLDQFEKDQVVRKPQDPRIGSYASKLKKEEAKISFKIPGIELHRKIMGMNPWPVAECMMAGERLRIFKSQFLARPADAESGTIIDVSDDMIVVACYEGCIGLLEVQLENRKRLPVSEFLKGYKVPTGLILGGQS
jgi:methionyl-tRNA formyltransferase